MLKSFWATVRQGKIELLDSTDLSEGNRVLVTILPNDEADFWLKSSQTSLDAVWDNTEDDIYTHEYQKDVDSDLDREIDNMLAEMRHLDKRIEKHQKETDALGAETRSMLDSLEISLL
jgi:hypothetical protein